MKTNRAPTTEIAGDTRVKKVLHVAHHQAKEAWLYAPTGVAIEINGQPMDISPGTPFPQVSVSLLKDGDNEVVLYYCRDGARTSIKFAAPEDIVRNAPQRQGPSPPQFHQQGRREDLGAAGGRVHGPPALGAVCAAGPLHLPGDRSGAGPPAARCPGRPAAADAGPRSSLFRLRPTPQTPAGTRVELAFRTGGQPGVRSGVLDRLAAGLPRSPLRASLFAMEGHAGFPRPLRTPLLRSVAVEAKVRRQPTPVWAGNLKTAAFHDERIRYTSIPFEYEDPLHPRMVALRRKYKLDAVVSGAASETEQLVKLRDWVSRQWKYQSPR